VLWAKLPTPGVVSHSLRQCFQEALIQALGSSEKKATGKITDFPTFAGLGEEEVRNAKTET
jgi:hypothetical protein